MVSGELTVASAHRSKVHPTTLPLQLLVTGATTTRIMVQLLLLLLLLMLPLSTRITLSLLFSVFVSPSGRSTMPIWWLSFLLVQLRVLLCTLLNPLPIQLHFLCHGGSRCIKILWDSANVLTICERRTHMDSLASLHSCLWFCYRSPVAWIKTRACACRLSINSEMPCGSRTYQYYVASDATFSNAKKSGSRRHYVALQAISRSLLLNYGDK